MLRRHLSGKVRVWALWGVVAILAASLAWRVVQAWVPGKVEAGSSPYMVIRGEKGFDKRGNLVFENQYVEAVRGDGARAKRQTTALVQQRTIYMANGDEILINDAIRKKSTFPRKHAAPHTGRTAVSSCLSESDVKAGWIHEGAEMVGVPAQRAARLVQRGPVRTMVAWHALEADCALLQLRLDHEDGVTVQELKSFTKGEPDQQLFKVDGYEEAMPSGLFPPVCLNGNCASIPDAAKAKLDRNYEQLRAQLPSR